MGQPSHELPLHSVQQERPGEQPEALNQIVVVGPLKWYRTRTMCKQFFEYCWSKVKMVNTFLEAERPWWQDVIIYGIMIFIIDHTIFKIAAQYCFQFLHFLILSISDADLE
ncbi:unnamed protein product [Bursaphelenchus okinawaensis]|uniref:Uncharacterized protein n=1 Tax=Bursaphelenchus okinawaensis TaxID=465554 RepID=A0A811KS24_9BILA|nr:unnamed protein product [Bursaphelenchus okinawaensis]CAG9109355.1 unnamed protein product [Bursaphelenchus okinawaensis]